MVSEDREGYVQTLLEIARDCRRHQALQATAMAHVAPLARVERILGNNRIESGLLPSTSGCCIPVAAPAVSGVTIEFVQKERFALAGSGQDPSGVRVPWVFLVLTDIYKGLSEATTGCADESYQIEVHGPFVSGFQ